MYHWDLKKTGRFVNSLVWLGITRLWHVAQRVSLAPPHNTLLAFLNLNGIFSEPWLFLHLLCHLLRHHLLIECFCRIQNNKYFIVTNKLLWLVKLVIFEEFLYPNPCCWAIICCICCCCCTMACCCAEILGSIFDISGSKII